jgi:glycosyltransferase involved in cell wall biosynthesis
MGEGAEGLDARGRAAQAAEMKISVVIPSYNSVRYIERTLDSILAQSYPSVEVIVLDGGSTDGTVDVLRRYDRHLAFWESERDRGQSHALNKGFARATGDIFAWQNADDTYVAGAFEAVVDAFRLHPEKQIVFGDYYSIDAEDRVIERNLAFDFSLRQFIFEGFHLNAQATFWRRGVHCRFGSFDEALHYTMDYEMLLRFGLREGEAAFYRVDAPLACFRRHSAQKTQGFDATALAEHRRIADRWNTRRFDAPHRWVRPLYRARRAYWYLRRGGGRMVVRALAETFQRR